MVNKQIHFWCVGARKSYNCDWTPACTINMNEHVSMISMLHADPCSFLPFYIMDTWETLHLFHSVAYHILRAHFGTKLNEAFSIPITFKMHVMYTSWLHSIKNVKDTCKYDEILVLWEMEPWTTSKSASISSVPKCHLAKY